MRRSHGAWRWAALALAAALVTPLAACSADDKPDVAVADQVDAALPDATSEQLKAAVDRAVAASGASGALVGVWAPWSGTWVTAIGSATPGGAAIAADETFPAGAITRAMTCDVLYGMVHDGAVKLSDSVTDYVDGLHDYEAVTLGDLCDSTSGFASYTPPLAARMTANPARVWNPRELAAYGVANTTPATPGSTFADSDTGYVLLGSALENVSRKSAQQLFDQYVFEPLGMTASSLAANATADVSGLYTPDADGAVACAAPVERSGLSPTAGFTASGLISDLADLGRYTRAMATGAREFDAKGRFADPLPAAADAPAWFTARGGAYQAGSLIGQYGSVPGFLTAAFADQNTGMTVVVALNDSRASSTLVRSLAWQLASIASKAPAASGETAPDAGLPWTAEDMGAQVAAAAVCPIP